MVEYVKKVCLNLFDKNIFKVNFLFNFASDEQSNKYKKMVVAQQNCSLGNPICIIKRI
jgi:hypothetical protein